MLMTNQHVIATAVFALFTLAAINANAESVAGQSKCIYKPTAANVANTDGYVVLLSETACTFSGSGFGEGATVLNQEVANLHQGTGDNSGYYTITNGADSTIAKWSGKVNTVMKDGNPMTSTRGQWEYVGGTGKYQGVKGKGEYNGYFTSATEYTVDWKGRKD
ncbi:MAG: hypothetical protein CVU27_03395 [Betaproteobacteria bacterium HGW-Betaproteobacteria-20]|nr:MAG: hypothetical protein CVU27_03395 [Betaproteobacteria bacterium HGW-Betaproteobacteria-20]